MTSIWDKASDKVVFNQVVGHFRMFAGYQDLCPRDKERFEEMVVFVNKLL